MRNEENGFVDELEIFLACSRLLLSFPLGKALENPLKMKGSLQERQSDADDESGLLCAPVRLKRHKDPRG